MIPGNFWQTKSLGEMTTEEWESLCDGCGKCCLHKLEDEDTGDVYYTNIACRFLDTHSCQCGDYVNRFKNVPACLDLTPAKATEFHWFPTTCAYRLIAEGQPLPGWHPLVSGSPRTIHTAGVSVRGRVVMEDSVKEDDYEDHIVYWVDQ